MTVAVFDVAALLQWAEPEFAAPPADRCEVERLWRQMVADLLAAADEVERLTGVSA